MILDREIKAKFTNNLINFYLRYLHIIVKIKYFQLNLNKKDYL